MIEHKLTIELVPQPLWGKSLSTTLSGSEWKHIRKRVLERAGNRCEVCGAQNGAQEIGYDGLPHKVTLYCHEVWEYDREQPGPAIQRLVGFKMVCQMCNCCIHRGFARTQGVPEESIIAHYTKVNSCTEQDYRQDVRAASLLWQKRNRWGWKQEIPDYHTLLSIAGEDKR